jgi:hypothetical protein
MWNVDPAASAFLRSAKKFGKIAGRDVLWPLEAILS